MRQTIFIEQSVTFEWVFESAQLLAAPGLARAMSVQRLLDDVGQVHRLTGRQDQIKERGQHLGTID
jgi:hypothetical protein